MRKQETNDEKKALLELIKVVDDNFCIKWYDVLSFSPIAIILLFIVLLGILLTLYLPLATLPEKIAVNLIFFGLIIAFFQVVVSSPKLLEEQVINRNYKRISGLMAPLVKTEKKLELKALITMKSKQPKFPLSEIYEMDESLFEKKKLLSKLYE